MAGSNGWMTRKEAAAFLSSIGCPLSHRTLANMAANSNAKRGPSFRRLNRIVRYHRDDLERWAERNSVHVA